VLREAWNRARNKDMDEPIMLSVVEAYRRLRISKTTLYDLMNTGELGFVKIRSRRFIPTRTLEEFIRRLEEQAAHMET
jgi:excisionase family DNA binding protein